MLGLKLLKDNLRGPMRYTPFEEELYDFSPSQLANLKEVTEGWYVEYKSQPPVIRDLAKSLSSFANQYGGWLFLGIEENSESNTADSFPGIEERKVPEVLESIRNAAKDVVRPQVAYQTRTIEGPLEAIDLNPGRSIIVVRVPEGANTPYIHNDGRIYIRIGDSSSPCPAKDKATFDLLYKRGEDRRSYLESLIERRPERSEAEKDQSYVHLIILSDPYETLGHRYKETYAAFCSVMKDSPIPFDNIYTAPDGFVARQVLGNDPFNRLLTWEFSRNCNSFITIPLSTLPSEMVNESLKDYGFTDWESYGHGSEFLSTLTASGLRGSSVLNLNMLLTVLPAVLFRYRALLWQAGYRGPFYVKARIENVWRAVPYLDLSQYVGHIKEFGVPVVQESEFIVPRGTSLETFEVLPELECALTLPVDVVSSGSINIWLHIMQALGIPGQLLGENAAELLQIANKEAEIHRARVSSGTGEAPRLDLSD